MKKLCASLVVIFLFTTFYACNKDILGEYNPKMKIEKIYDESDGRYLKEHWLWDGDLLKRIDYYRKNGNLDYSQNYVYDGKRLSRIEMGDQYSEFLYDGNKLTTINTYHGTRKVETYSFTFEKKKLAHISIERDADTKESVSFFPLSLFVPTDYCTTESVFSHGDSKREKYDFSKAEVDLIWQGDNVQYMKMQLTRPDSIQKLTFTYVYDQGINPRNGFFILFPEQQLLNDNPAYLFCSKNNAVSVFVTDQYDVHSKSDSYTYGYEYYKKYPTKVFKTFINVQTYNSDSTLLYSYQYLQASAL